MNMPLGNKVAVVTGAAQGLGLAIARRLAQDGASVLLCDLQEEKVRGVADALIRDGLQAESAPLDVTDAPAVTAVFEETFRNRGRLDILVNSAGLGQKVTPTVELADEEWQRILEVNLTGTFYCCRAAGRFMQRQESGSMVNLASINAHSPAALVAAYNAAKAGVASLTRTLAVELAAYGVRVNAVSPGPVYTDFNRKTMAQRSRTLGISRDEMVERVRRSIPLGRWGEPQDIASMVAFLCGSEASWITGQVFQVTGGLQGVSATPPRTPRTKE
jgi:3-oxoacyl-[acyl-carrier protein] reductase/2-hydroxycyclohexanecarboxyl-CoA dehydrogenase